MKNSHEESSTENNKPLSFFEVVGQAFSLMFALQNKSGRKRLLDLAESNPKPLIFSGVVAMIIFFSFCFITSQLVLKLVTG